ncbi:hypothetical protein KKH39_02710 [Patescibacteria group bacterium]|nr:hypothetical protein [Patescibacteria group bacterium]
MSGFVWRRNFEIYRMPVIVTGPPVFSAIRDQKKLIGRDILKDFLLIGENYDLTGAYIPDKQLRNFIEAILDIIKTKPDFVFKFQRQGIVDIKKLFNFIKENLNYDFGKMSDDQLVKFHDKLQKKFFEAEGRLTLTTWFVDSDGEDLSKFLMSIVEDKIKQNKIDISVAEAFSLLTTPDKMSLSMQEEIESLEILQAIKKDPKAKKIFTNQDIKYIEDNLSEIDVKLRNKILKHYKKWLWMPYTYIGPAYELDYYISMWSGLLRQRVKAEQNIKVLRKQTLDNKKSRQELIKKLSLKGKEKKYFDLAKDIIYIKSYRKDAWFYYCYLLEFVHKEMAKRLHLSLKQFRMMTFDEVALALKKGKFDTRTLNQRFKKSVYIFSGLKAKIYASEKAEKFLATQNLEQEQIKIVDEIRGTSARPGKINGQVKIVNLPEEMHKMNKGDVMVARTTFPSLVPAMKKAAAIVTNDGGITCHAAIVARELKIPCVVGTKIATKVFKDGDRVSVDAINGIIKKL